jgi:hypothetical protein
MEDEPKSLKLKVSIETTDTTEVKSVNSLVDSGVELPKSSGHDTIMIVVNSVVKNAHFVPTITAAGTACLYVQNVWRHHGLPQKIVSDRGPQFVAEFTRELYRLLGIKLAATTAYHPQGDKQMERVNQELEQYLRLFVNQRQDDWSNLVPLTEFQYNNHIHSATQHQLFLLETGSLPRMGFEPDQPPSWLESVNKFTEQMKTMLEEAKAALAKSKDDMARYYNQKRTRALEYNSETRYTLMLATSRPLGHPRNSLTDTLDLGPLCTCFLFFLFYLLTSIYI